MHSSFDFIVVGAGSAGCVVANRLSAHSNVRVALIEAGGSDWHPWIHIPVGYFKTMGNRATDWCFETQPDPGLAGRALKWPRGRTMGGSSSINGLLYVRGQAQDYDHWQALGNEGWGWDSVLPLFKRSETWSGVASDARGNSGNLRVEETQFKRDITDAWLQAAQSAGYPYNSDYNSGDQYGVAPFQMTIHKGLRCSAAKAFIAPIKRRPNLVVFKHSEVQNLVFKDDVCTGVALTCKGKTLQIDASREVVLCAGAIGSPHILMRSGIGDPEDLAPANIALRESLPGVGKNLQDHLQARPVFKCTTPTINLETNNLLKQFLISLEYLVSRKGPMTMAASLCTGFLSTKLSPERPDIQFHIQPWSADSPDQGPHKFSAYTASVLQLRPQSRGRLRLDPKRPAQAPLIEPNYLSEEIDRQTLVEGLRITRNIARQSPLSEVTTDEHGDLANIADNDDAALLEWARRHSTTIYHPTGTCKMGQDSESVVDARLRVHRIKGLRVADCSIMPQIVSANTNAPAIMIGEKCSDMLLEDMH